MMHQTNAMPPELLSKASSGETLTQAEQSAWEQFPAVGHELLKHIPRLDKVAENILYQGSRIDGTQGPQTPLPEGELPLGSRIIKAANDFLDLRAMGKTRMECLSVMRRRTNWYDPDVLDALVTELPQMAAPTEPRRTDAVALKELRAGMRLATSLYTSRGLKLIGSGRIVSEAMLVRLRMYAAVWNQGTHICHRALCSPLHDPKRFFGRGIRGMTQKWMLSPRW